MNREFKFRIWDEENSQFVYFDLRRLHGHWSGVILNELGADLMDDEVVGMSDKEKGLLVQSHIMQYTGLKDRTGVEIYEGDILESRSVYNRPDIIGSAVGRRAVVWENVEAPCDNVGIRFVGFDLDWDEAAKSLIVGNIHESPEKLGQPYVCQHGLSFVGEDYCRPCLQESMTWRIS